MFADIVGNILSNTWSFLSNVNVPGTEMTFMGLMIGIFGFICAIGMFKTLFNIVTGFDGGSKYKNSSTKNPRISKERKNDEK